MFNKLKSQRTLVNSTLDLRTLNQNILYVTRQADAILKRVDMLITEQNLTKQANQYFEDHKSEQFDETSPQPEQDEQ